MFTIYRMWKPWKIWTESLTQRWKIYFEACRKRSICPLVVITKLCISFLRSRKASKFVILFSLNMILKQRNHMGILQRATTNRWNLDVIPEIIKYVNNRLPQIFNNHCEEDGDSDENKKQKFQVEQHTTKACIVLSRRKE